MKIILLILMTLLLLIFSCEILVKTDEVRDFIPGTYIRFSQHEYGTEYDTLIINLQNKAANEYKIQRKWKYERVLDGGSIEPEYKRLITSGIYNASNKLLQESETGLAFSFDAKKLLLYSGPIQYKKIK